MGKTLKIKSHVLIPKHVKLSDSEVKKVLEKYGVAVKELPKILRTDPAIADLNVDAGDVIKIIRKSEITGEIIYYRGVVHE